MVENPFCFTVWLLSHNFHFLGKRGGTPFAIRFGSKLQSSIYGEGGFKGANTFSVMVWLLSHNLLLWGKGDSLALNHNPLI